MSQSTPPIDTPHSTGKELFRGSLLALAVAGLVLVVAVLPAEYGIDPTGAGKALGLTKLHSLASATSSTSSTTPASTNPAPSAPVITGSTVAAPGEVRALTIAAKQSTQLRHDQMEIILPPGKGLEVKTHLAKGASLVYTWKTTQGELIKHDFHGEPINAKEDEFESFVEENNVNHSHAVLIAPFTGLHGWYWKNKTAAPVTVILQASGFYTDIFRK